jgi:hypothetical protein
MFTDLGSGLAATSGGASSNWKRVSAHMQIRVDRHRRTYTISSTLVSLLLNRFRMSLGSGQLTQRQVF